MNADTVRIVLVGTGGMGARWLSMLARHPHITVTGIVELDTERADDALRQAGLNVPVAKSVEEFAGAADAIVNAAVPVAHKPVSLAALSVGMAVLCEKPAADTVEDAVVMAAAATAADRLLMISQSRRYGPGIAAFRQALRSHQPDGPGLLLAEHFKAARFGGFRETMPHPLLIDMAIHAFDTARDLIGRDPVSVFCEESNPDWSWFAHGASATALFDFGDARRFVYTGSWIAPGAPTSWNSRWRALGATSTVLWDGETSVQVHTEHAEAEAVPVPPAPAEIDGALAAFLVALRDGRHRPPGEIRENIASLAMVEAAALSAERGVRVRIHEVLDAALTQAIASETDPARLAILLDWAGRPAGPPFGFDAGTNRV